MLKKERKKEGVKMTSDITAVVELLKAFKSDSDWKDMFFFMIMIDEWRKRQSESVLQLGSEKKDSMEKMMDYLIKLHQMQLMREMIKELAKGGTTDEKFKEILKEMKEQMGDKTYEKMIEMMEKSFDRTLELVKETNLRAKKEAEEKTRQIQEIVAQILQKWDQDKIEMLRRWQETIKELKSKGEVEKIRELIDYYNTLKGLFTDLQKTLQKEYAIQQPLVTEKGINWDKVISIVGDLADRFLSTSSYASKPPPRKVVKTMSVPRTEQIESSIEVAKPVEYTPQPEHKLELPKEEETIEISEIPSEGGEDFEINLEEVGGEVENIEISGGGGSEEASS